MSVFDELEPHGAVAVAAKALQLVHTRPLGPHALRRTEYLLDVLTRRASPDQPGLPPGCYRKSYRRGPLKRAPATVPDAAARHGPVGVFG